MFEEYKEKRYAPPPILKKLVTMGYLGQKTGKGFYDWSDPKDPFRGIPDYSRPGSRLFLDSVAFFVQQTR